MADEILGGATPDLSGILGQILSNKELMSKIGEIAATNKPLSGESDSTKPLNESQQPVEISSLLSNPDITSKLPDVINVIKPLVSEGKSNGNGDASFDKRLGLLMAMKPYLSPKRCEAVDYIVRISKLSQTLKGLKL